MLGASTLAAWRGDPRRNVAGQVPLNAVRRLPISSAEEVGEVGELAEATSSLNHASAEAHSRSPFPMADVRSFACHGDSQRSHSVRPSQRPSGLGRGRNSPHGRRTQPGHQVKELRHRFRNIGNATRWMSRSATRNTAPTDGPSRDAEHQTDRGSLRRLQETHAEQAARYLRRTIFLESTRPFDSRRQK
jgi:hypothetical protein